MGYDVEVWGKPESVPGIYEMLEQYEQVAGSMATA
jgi:hypothetical protein